MRHHESNIFSNSARHSFRSVIEFTFNYAIEEKFAAWRVNSALNFTRKTDITVMITSRFVGHRFFVWNLTYCSLVREWIFRKKITTWRVNSRSHFTPKSVSQESLILFKIYWPEILSNLQEKNVTLRKRKSFTVIKNCIQNIMTGISE